MYEVTNKVLTMKDIEFLEKLTFVIEEIKEAGETVNEDTLFEFITGESFENQKELLELGNK